MAPSSPTQAAAAAGQPEGELDALRRENASLQEQLLLARKRPADDERLLRGVFEGSLDAMLIANDRGEYVDANPAACELFGLPLEKLVGRSVAQFAAPEYDFEAAQRAFLAHGKLLGRFPLQRPDGSQRLLDFRAATNVAPGLHLSILRDVTDELAERKHTEDTLAAARLLLEEAQAIAHVGSWVSGMGMSDELAWSPECYRIFGVEQATPMTVESFLACVHPADRDQVIRASLDATERDAPYDIEHRVQWPDGQVRRVRERATVERDAAGRPSRMIGTVADITDQHLAHQELRQSEERYRRIVESTSEGVWIYDGKGVTTFMSTRMASMLGVTVQEAVGQPISTFMDAATSADSLTAMERRRRGVSERRDLHLRRKDGSDLWVSKSTNSLFDASGQFEAVLALLTDVSAQRLFEQARARLSAIVESSEDAIVSMALDGEVLTWNRSAEKLHQYSADEMVGTSIFRLVPAALLDEERRVFERAARNEALAHHETRRLRKDGSEIEVALTMSPIRDAAGGVIGVSKIARDLTARRLVAEALRRTEEQFRQAQKMEAVGRLAGGVAHDFNNLLSVVLSYSSLAVADLKEGDPLRADMLEIQAAGERATALTRQLLAFSRQQVLQPRVLEVGFIVEGMRSMLGRLLGEDVELSVVAEPDIGRIQADPGQIEQVLMNLAVNARDAMPDGGSLTITLANVELAAAASASAAAPAGAAPGPYVTITVRDTGTGMDATTRARIFEPFFTTKEAGKGTGLGLATVFGIVVQSGGYLGVETAPGQGSAFTVYLPRTDQAVDVPSSAGPLLQRRGTETILLVEDENEVRTVARLILRRQGYHVLEAANGGEAILIAQEYSPAIHLLLTDVVMPRMSGRKLAEQLAQRRPEMKLLFVSGYTDDAMLHHGVLEAGVAFLQKPFSPDSLLRKVRDVLDAPRG